MALFRCDCGVIKLINLYHVKRGLIRSCGCMIVESCKARLTKHGQAKTRNQTKEYQTWCGMRKRCLNPKSPRFKNYGGRGIKIEWSSFEDFYKDMGPRPSPNHSIERIDNDGPYAPWNCRWATKLEQANNKTTSSKLSFNNLTLSLAEWSRKTGIPRSTLFNRKRLGWASEKILTH